MAAISRTGSHIPLQQGKEDCQRTCNRWAVLWDTGYYDWTHKDDYAPSRTFRTSEELAKFCSEIRTAWFQRARLVGDDLAEEGVETDRGLVTHLQLLESQAIHTAQHLRQIYVFMKQIGITPEQELMAEGMAPIILGDEVF